MQIPIETKQKKSSSPGAGSSLKKLKDIKVGGAGDLVKKLFRPDKPRINNNTGREILFEDPELWPDEVDGSDLLNELKGVFDRFLILPERAETALCLWVAFAWTHDAFSISPILDFRSPTKRCGKSTALRVVHRLVPRPLPSSNISTAALFRSIEYYKPTLLVDEVDTFLKFNDEILTTTLNQYINIIIIILKLKLKSK